MDEGEIVRIWNEYCTYSNKYDDEILDAYRLEEYVNSCEDKMSLLNRFYFGHDEENEDSSANPNRNYFCFNGYGNVVSFDYIYNQFTNEFYNLDIDSLVDYIVGCGEHFDNCELQEIVEEYSED